MVFQMPVLVYEEKNCVNNHAEALGKFGRKAMIVTGKHSSRANGSFRM